MNTTYIIVELYLMNVYDNTQIQLYEMLGRAEIQRRSRDAATDCRGDGAASLQPGEILRNEVVYGIGCMGRTAPLPCALAAALPQPSGSWMAQGWVEGMG